LPVCASLCAFKSLFNFWLCWLIINQWRNMPLVNHLPVLCWLAVTGWLVCAGWSLDGHRLALPVLCWLA
jgi:hypothetical protein